MRATTALSIALLTALAGCEESAPPIEGSEPAPAEAVAPEATAAPTAEPEPRAPTEPETREAPLAEGAEAGGIAEAGRALQAAIQAGVAAETGGTPCDRAYNGALAMLERMRLETGQEGVGEPVPRDEFLATCRALPAEAQLCMTMSYALEHQSECAQYVSDDRVQRLRRRLRGATAPSP